MKWRPKINLTLLTIFLCGMAIGQNSSFKYKRDLQGIEQDWHKITLPDEVFGKINSNFSDLRILGITDKQDTTTAPYLLQIAETEFVEEEISFTLINQVSNQNGAYFTFEVPTDKAVNQITLDFKEKNFDWRLALEGSQDLNEWYTLADDYRILSIENTSTKYQFTKLNFSTAKYRYLRVLIKEEKDPKFLAAKIYQGQKKQGIYREHPIKVSSINHDKETKRTIIDLELKYPLPLYFLQISIPVTYDYYRPISINYVTDSVNTDQGWRYNYRNLASGTLTSLEENAFQFSNTIAQKLRIIIVNQDNEPLKFDDFKVRAYAHDLVARFSETADYALFYGNREALRPRYDIDRFQNNIPTALTSLTLGEEQILKGKSPKVSKPLFQNKIWLWGIMVIIIGLLGWFSLKMMRNG